MEELGITVAAEYIRWKDPTDSGLANSCHVATSNNEVVILCHCQHLLVPWLHLTASLSSLFAMASFFSSSSSSSFSSSFPSYLSSHSDTDFWNSWLNMADCLWTRIFYLYKPHQTNRKKSNTQNPLYWLPLTQIISQCQWTLLYLFSLQTMRS